MRMYFTITLFLCWNFIFANSIKGESLEASEEEVLKGPSNRITSRISPWEIIWKIDSVLVDCDWAVCHFDPFHPRKAIETKEFQLIPPNSIHPWTSSQMSACVGSHIPSYLLQSNKSCRSCMYIIGITDSDWLQTLGHLLLLKKAHWLKQNASLR